MLLLLIPCNPQACIRGLFVILARSFLLQAGMHFGNACSSSEVNREGRGCLETDKRSNLLSIDFAFLVKNQSPKKP